MESLQEKISRLEAALAELPIGYISRKVIHGKVRQYLQWTEAGKKKSKYLDAATAAVLAEKIARRRELQQELKTAKALLPKKVRTKTSNSFAYSAEVFTGKRLQEFAQHASSFKSRPLLENIIDYITCAITNKVFILYGLRRTGKTTLLQQTIEKITDNKLRKTAFLQIRPGNTLAQINKDLKNLQNRGYKYIFIDEVTLLDDFIEGAALFSDIYVACGMKIVLSGTDSLGFLLAEDEQLYDRCELLHTTFISYKEFEEILGIYGIDEYIRYGGTMSISGFNYNIKYTFSSKKSTDKYVDSAIAKNIQNSLKFYQAAGHFRHLQDLYNKNELTSAINRVVEDINHQFTIDVLTHDFISHDLGISARNLRRDREQATDILDTIDRYIFTDRLKKALDIKNKDEQIVEITDAHRIEIKEYLDLLDLTVDISVQYLPVRSEKEYMTVISQPGLRYSQAKELLQQLLLDANFQTISTVERERVLERIIDEIKGRMMEEIVLLETKKALPEKKVFKLKFAVGEFDMVIYNPKNITCEIYEIKHSKEHIPYQYRHLVNKNKCKDTEFRFGNITKKCVIYRGETFTDGEIEYQNVEEYLKKLYGVPMAAPLC